MNRALLRSPDLAWPTLLLALGVPLFWVLVVAWGWTGGSWAIAIPLATALAYVAFTPMHDAAHKSLARAPWLNGLCGRLAGLPLLAPFPAFRLMHLAHHRLTNQEDDPDLWSGSGGWALPFHWLTQDLHYYFLILSGRHALKRGAWLEVLAGLGLQVGVLAWAAWAGQLLPLLLLVFLPARLATGMLAFAFDYLPHRPHETTAKEDRFRATHILPAPALTPLMLWQNYHLVHHLYPGVPFYRYAVVWRDQREALIAKGAEERTLFAR